MNTRYMTHYEKIIITNIDLDAYNIDSSNLSELEKINIIFELFKKEYIHNFNRRKDIKKEFASWLQGLPSLLTVPFYNSEILTDALLAGFNLPNEDTEDVFLEMYWLNLSNAFFTLKENL